MIRIKDNTPILIAKVQSNGSLAVKRALDDILRESRPRTPKLTGSLRDSTRTQVTGTKGKVGWLMVYASYQERGRRADGSHVVKRYTTGGTGANFAKNAVKKVTSNPNKYLKGLLR